MNNNKYISFEPWWGGFSNIRMSFELACAISEITNRKLIIPPKFHILFFTSSEKNSFQDMWDLIDEKNFKNTFNCIDYRDVPEYVKLEDESSYFNGVEKISKLIDFNIENNHVIVDKIYNNKDFNSFSKNRNVIRTSFNDKFIHFPKNLFGHFYYHVYAPTPKKRLDIKNKIKKGITYRQDLHVESYKVGDNIGSYNAIHFRRNDFEDVRSDTMIDCNHLLKNIKDKISNELPLYIATDKNDRSFFLPLRKHYNVFFADDFNFNCTEKQLLAVEQIICSNSERFLGSHLSTFSDFINIMRGYKGLECLYREGTNFNRGELIYKEYPWEVEHYSWDKTWDYQWKLS